jgi:ABC-type sugar transport system, periplasmic component
MLKKVISVILATMMILSMVAMAGCAKKDDSTDTGNNKGVTKAPAKTEKVQITYSIWGTAEEEKTTQAIADKFNSSQDKIEVKVTAIPTDSYVTRLNTMATAKELPDCGMVKEDMAISWASNGMLADISKMYEGTTDKALASTAFTYQGKTVAYTTANEVLILYYNKDMFDKAGIAYPPAALDGAWTWDQFVDTAKKLTVDKKGKHPGEAGFDANSITQYGAMVENLTWQLEEWCLSNGGGFYNADGTQVAIGDDASIDAIQKVADLYLKDHVAPLSTGLTDDGVSRSLIAGTVAMTTNGTWNVGTCLNKAKEEGLNYGVAVLPYMKDKVTLSTCGAFAVFEQSKHQKEAMEFMKWLTQEENSWNLISSGIWMPKLEKWYTDESLTHKWVDNPNFPDYATYKTAVVDNAISSSAKSAAWFYTPNTTDFNTLLSSVLGDVWTGKTTAKDAITSNLDALKAAHDGNK